MEKRRENAGWTPVPQFGGWDQKGIDATDYSVVFTKARANRKLNKADVSHSLGSEQELMASARRHHYQQHLNNRRETQDDDPVMKKKRILTYINCCIRPN
ncbi:hypothetical protein BRARA_C00881 [Brassica rapa]|uniref:RIN4 pathogenic type III effector avirulence factor Avr cleavage site domain-containing protein n=1 Tax=Brassica campestris TaxID=3711 RepID=A0A397ZZD6_BRACM|nr:uncharacterized protein LOC103856382 [Brassica rapa]XP_013730618.1 uncharacterized protein LOC106434323 [Brassica napus]RID68740.1 hypothetical protein BRARA_C00881 [Brassica rapa]